MLDGKKQDRSVVKFYSNGQIKETFFLNDNKKKEGRYLLFDNFGKLKTECFYKNGQLNGPCIKHYSRMRLNLLSNEGTYINKDVCFYKNGKINGELKVFLHDVLISIKNYKNGRLHGKCINWDMDGFLRDTSCYVNGQLHGEKVLFANKKGELLEKHEMYYKDVLHGRSELYVDGRISYIDEYKKGELHGTCYTFYDSGELCSICQFKNNKKNGLFLSFTKKGIVDERILFKNSIAVRSL
jgi:antitoxin component YwqK of YwqJK toxin-antitoxin module